VLVVELSGIVFVLGLIPSTEKKKVGK
jgi:hypothetical protein